MEQMLYGLMLRSGNDAAMAIAEHVGGERGRVCADDERARGGTGRGRPLRQSARPSTKKGHKASRACHGRRSCGRACRIRTSRALPRRKKKIIPWTGNEFSRVLQNKNRLLTSYEGAIGRKRPALRTGRGDAWCFPRERNGMAPDRPCVLNCSTWFDTAETLFGLWISKLRDQFPLAKRGAVLAAPECDGRTGAEGRSHRRADAFISARRGREV